PMLAKVIAHGPDRATALRRLRAALDETRVLGVTVNTGFLRRLLDDEDVAAGRLDTGLVEARLDVLAPTPMPPEVPVASALAAHAALETTTDEDGWADPFSAPSGWRIGGPAWTVYRFATGGGEPLEVRVRATRTPGEHEVATGEGPGAVASADVTPAGLLLRWDRVTSRFDHAVERLPDGEVHWLARGADVWRLRAVDLPGSAGTTAADTGDGLLVAPMPGTVTVVKAAAGDTVTAGQVIVIVEAMKMEHALTAPFDGTVAELRTAPGASVTLDEVVAVIEPSTGEDEADDLA
ncbi:MAG: biotin/lipoyl-containing protein, partial [Actinoallomurus sp.]